MARILVVEDDRATGQLMLTLAESMGHEAALASDGESALAIVRQHPPEMIISDVLMEPMDGLELLEIVRREFPEISVVLFSASRDPEVQVRALRLGSVQFLAKPLRIEQLKKVLEKTIADRAVPEPTGGFTLRAPVREVTVEGLEEALRPYYPGPRLRELRFRVARLAKVRNRVLVEAGEGVFNAEILPLLHRHSHRAAGPLKVVNCAASDLKELETEWRKRPQEWLQPFANGALVLLQVEHLPLPLQGVLADVVRLAQEVRIVATTHRDPDQLLAEGRLNESLYFRLSLFSMRIPPVVEMGADVCDMLLDAITTSANYHAEGRPEIDPVAREALVAYSWPRNYTELHQVADYVAGRLTNGVLTLAALPEALAAARWPDLVTQIEDCARLHIDRVVRTTTDLARASAVLGLSEQVLRGFLETGATQALPLFAAKEGVAKPEAPSYESVLVVSPDELWRSSIVAMATRPSRLVVGVADALAAISTLLCAPKSFDFVLIAPPIDVFSAGEFGQQLRRICPGSTLALLEAFPEPEDCDPYHEVYNRPDDSDQLERVLAMLREYRNTVRTR